MSGLQAVLLKAAASTVVSEELIAHRSNFAEKMGFYLEDSERQFLNAVAERELRGMIADIEVPEPKNEIVSSWVSTVLSYSVLAIVIALAAIAWPARPTKFRAPHEKACYANMREILGAIEMYNMQNQRKFTILDRFSMQKLQETGCLRQIPECPEYVEKIVTRQSGEEYAGKDLDISGHIACKMHGTIE
ncbi:MAG TPA: hypothetical protein PKO06_08385 [Candidatus Ozemobacteraceae bacterium]|nr:hypothetical protein [Candidatus Ozemobacteraceae bacterium]